MLMTLVPLVCMATLHTLEKSLDGERSLCQAFVSRYIEMWPTRFERIHAAVTSDHYENAMDSTLSLRSSSMMVGAARLSDLTMELVRLLESGNAALAATNLTELQICGNETAGHLTASYVNVA